MMKPTHLIVCLLLVGLASMSISPIEGDVIVSKHDHYDASEVVNKSPKELIELRGFESEVHYVRTKDGYHLQVVRIINPAIEDRSLLKRPVVFNHGLLESATIWLINSREVKPKFSGHLCEPAVVDQEQLAGPDFLSAPFMLANKGYDVWLMSMRGTDFSLEHDHLNKTSSEFWDYSLDDFALKDVPAVVKYVLSKTGAEKVGYVGHSQATWSIFSLLADKPHYAQVIEPVVAVAPVAYLKHITSAVKPLLPGIAKNPKNKPFPINAHKLRNNINDVCGRSVAPPTNQMACNFIGEAVSGPGNGYRKGFSYHLPYYSSLKVIRHFNQQIMGGRYARYDYGPVKNFEVYGQATSPEWPVEKIKSKALTLVWSKTDAFCNHKDVNHFKRRLKVPFREIFINRKFNHMDLILDEDARQEVNAPMLEVFEDYEHQTGVCANHVDANNESNELDDHSTAASYSA